MGNNRLTRLLFQQITRKQWHPPADTRTGAFHGRPYSSNSLKEALKPEIPEEISSSAVCIYKVPDIMRRVQRKAYQPNVISIGPYHHGVERLEAMEKLKLKFVCRLFDQNGLELDLVKNALGKLEEEARICYSEEKEIRLGKDGFVEMMLVDGCFVVELLREVWRRESEHQIPFIQRWMLPIFRRDLIMLENQLPFFVLSELFEITSKNTTPPPPQPPCLQKLALHFFNPLLQRDFDTTPPKIVATGEGSTGARHFLDLFRSTIVPVTPARRKQPNMIRSTTELKEAGVKIQRAKHSQLLDVTYEEGVLKIPPLYIDDYKGTLFRNMMAFEKCHRHCHPDVTTYMFFFDGLINSAKDVGLLHYKEVLQHSLGSNREVAKLVSTICREIDRVADESYLYMVADDANSYFASIYAKFRAGLVRHYFSSWLVGFSTMGAIFALYLTLVQTASGIASAIEPLGKGDFGSYIKDSVLLPFSGKPSSRGGSTTGEDESL
ncbi:UPF0481 protein At3g47200-like [Corylus avellana]|uniref:UPF0481 protein At3g47200-like n=1 Tax=Corylus avellana TaxID=13451 RepID=UPI00286AECE2|nr:UPF0481 protein At3g47200-like [Corylus avellana]XP_059452461.1 UPF0481 protein At3g47200-like [Corylus avellana]